MTFKIRHQSKITSLFNLFRNGSLESRWICICGLSSNQPFCDGSHKKTADEEAGKDYKYNADGTRIEIK